MFARPSADRLGPSQYRTGAIGLAPDRLAAPFVVGSIEAITLVIRDPLPDDDAAAFGRAIEAVLSQLDNAPVVRVVLGTTSVALGRIALHVLGDPARVRRLTVTSITLASSGSSLCRACRG